MADEFPPEVAGLPVCPRRGLPIPFIAEVRGGVGNFGILDPERAHECYEHRLCAMCGQPMGEEVALLGDQVSIEPGGFWIEPPVHERCGELAMGGLCPFMSRERVPRRPVVDDGTVAYLGGLDEMEAVGRTLPKRPVVMAITARYRMAMHLGDGTGNPMPVYLSWAVRRTRTWVYRDGRAVEVTEPAAGPSPAHVTRHQPRRTSRAARRGRS